MTRKDFIFIADVIRNVPDKCRPEVAQVFAERLGATNPRFNRALFVQAALGVVPLTAHKALGVSNG